MLEKADQLKAVRKQKKGQARDKNIPSQVSSHWPISSQPNSAFNYELISGLN